MKRITLAVLFVLSAARARALETASFLNIGVGARGLGMGGAYTALTDDANALYWNPAGLSALDKKEITASHAELAQGTRLDFLAYAQHTSLATFAGGATYLSQGTIEGRDALGHPVAGFNASDFAGALGLGRKTELVDLGASVKLVQSHIGSAQAQTIALDLGARKALGPIVLGTSLRNIGPGMKFDSETDDLPLRFTVGAAYKLSGGHALTAEWTTAPRAGGNDVGFGGEYQAINGVLLRAGYTTQSAIGGGSGFDAVRGLTLGVGLRRDSLSIDYAAVPMGELGSTHRFSLSWKW